MLHFRFFLLLPLLMLRLRQRPSLTLMLMLTLLARFIMDSQFTMPMLLVTLTMLESLLELTMDMDVFLDMVPLETEDMLDTDIMDMPAM